MRNLFWGFVFILFGVLFLLDNLGYADFSEIVHNYWPLLLVLWGLSILMRPHRHHTKTEPSSSQQVDPDLLHQSNVFGDIYNKIISKYFKGGSLSTVFGDCDIDLTEAGFADGEHELKLHSVFGDSLITLPKDAAVSVIANSTFGDLTIFGQQKSGFATNLQTTTPTFASSQNRLKISVSKVFGNIRII
jgi:predicted membrane protein